MLAVPESEAANWDRISSFSHGCRQRRVMMVSSPVRPLSVLLASVDARNGLIGCIFDFLCGDSLRYAARAALSCSQENRSRQFTEEQKNTPLIYRDLLSCADFFSIIMSLLHRGSCASQRGLARHFWLVVGGSHHMQTNSGPCITSADDASDQCTCRYLVHREGSELHSMVHGAKSYRTLIKSVPFGIIIGRDHGTLTPFIYTTHHNCFH